MAERYPSSSAESYRLARGQLRSARSTLGVRLKRGVLQALAVPFWLTCGALRASSSGRAATADFLSALTASLVAAGGSVGSAVALIVTIPVWLFGTILRILGRACAHAG